MTRRPVATAWLEAPAKVNLGLVVTGRRADGYHSLDTVFLRLALHDHLEARPASDPAGPDELEVRGGQTVPVEDNSVLRAVDALRRATGRPLPALRLRLDKHIPAAAGLGGGSSDAAAALRLAADAWGLAAAEVAWPRLAAALGADVPFFAAGLAAARGRGIGEELEALPAPAPPAGVLLVTPQHRLRTAEVFAALDREHPDRNGHDLERRIEPIDALAEALRGRLDGGRLTDLGPGLRDANDLWAPAVLILPTLATLRQRLEARLGRSVLLSGSGPTLLALYPSEQAAASAAASLEGGTSSLGDAVTIISTATSTGGPA
jgi:4-diphosphocytidyl-2-C-methyl-D-erythritol kinase